MEARPVSVDPFTCSFDAGVPEVLARLRCSIAITTYQAGKLVFISPGPAGRLVQLTRSFKKAMGLAVDGKKMALACEEEVLIFTASNDLAQHYPNKPGTYDSLFMPRATYYTGAVDLHDLAFGSNGTLYAVNTAFSCVAVINDDHSFTPIWKPPFISRMSSDDRCHLNGIAMENGVPRYATAFGSGDTAKSWRATVPGSGVLMDMSTDTLISADLAMPHSPRLYGGALYVLLSATGEVARVDLRTGTLDVIAKLDGFVRGLAIHEDHLFVGLSAIRPDSSSFGKLALKNTDPFAGLAIIDLRSGAVVGRVRYRASVEEIYDVQILPGVLRPNVLNTAGKEHLKGLTTPEQTFWAPL